MNYEKPGGAMHEVLRRAFDELRLHNNPQGTIAIVTHALANADGLPPLPPGKEYNADILSTTLPSNSRAPDASSSSAAGGGGGTGVNGSEISRSRALGGAAANTNQVSPSNAQWISTGSVGAALAALVPTTYQTSVFPLPGSAEWLNKRFNFNRTQVLRLLLIRCEAFSALKQHNRALQDAERAVDVSLGQSAEAYFNVGREQRRQFNIAESSSAFDTAEALLRSMQQAMAAGKVVVDGWIQETSSDEAFWADRGFRMEEVREMGVTRWEYEMQERNRDRTYFTAAGSFSGPTSPASGSAAAGGYTLHGEPATPLSSAGRTRGRLTADGVIASSFAMSPREYKISQGTSATTRSVNPNTSVEGEPIDDEAPVTSSVNDLMRCGMSPNELAMWRRLASESRALLTMRQSHTVPSTMLSSTMTLLERRISGTRGGLVISMENNTNGPLRFVGAHCPDGLYHESYSFPDVVSKAHCGVAMLHPRGWGGYSGAVCYELHETLCCFLYFESPLLGSVKYGVRFVDLRASDIRRAYAEIYKETGVYGIAGGTTSAAIAPLAPTITAGGGMNGVGTSTPGGTSRGSLSGVSMRGACTPLTTTVASMNAARAAIRTPPSNMWVPAHAATSAAQRPVKASSKMIWSQSIAFSLAEVLAVRLRSVELIPALEYVGAVTLKKIGSVSRRYRELINNLPPPMFYGVGRRAYPDYSVASDRYISPWLVRDPEPVTWKLIFDGRVAEQEEFFLVDESDMQRHIICFSADAQTKVTGYVYLGDKRCLQYIIKESWIPFSNTLYLTTPIGRTFASCSAMSNQSQYTLSLNSSSNQGSSGGNGGGSGASGGDVVLYTARKRVHRMPTEAARATPVPATGSLASTRGGSEDTTIVQRKGSSSGNGGGGGPLLHGRTTANHTTSNIGSNHSTNMAAGTTATTAAPGTVVGSTGAASPIKSVSPQPHLSSAQSILNGPSLGIAGTVNSGGGIGALAAASAATMSTTTQPQHFTVWRSQRVSGGAVAGGGAPSTTNGGADITAEVKINPALYGMVTKGYCAAEITLFPGADAMLVSLLSFLMARW